MKLQSTNLLETLTVNEIKMLTSEVKETVCKNFETQKKRNFTAANLWDLQRRKKSFSSKRFGY